MIFINAEGNLIFFRLTKNLKIDFELVSRKKIVTSLTLLNDHFQFIQFNPH